jgi:hypothetical protein
MQPEHEEAMRQEFAHGVELGKRMYNVDTEAEIEQLGAQQEEIGRRWQEGPHAEHWQFLNDAWHDWREAPDTMARLADNIAHERAQNGGCGFDEVQVRSLDQARQLYEADMPRRRRQGRGR